MKDIFGVLLAGIEPLASNLIDNLIRKVFKWPYVFPTLP